MGLKRDRPTTAPPFDSLSSSSSSGDGAWDAGDMEPLSPRSNNGYSVSFGSDSVDFGSSDMSDSSAGSSSRASGKDATITPLDLLPKELRAIANKTRPDSDIPWTSDDATCYYYKMDDDRCFHPRSCRDCLEMPGCMINQLGQCVDQSIDRYNGFMDFRAAITRNMSGPHAKNPNATRTQQYHFPAKSVSYCPVDEPTCRYCRPNDFRKKIDSRFCIGHNNNRKCICISICESAVRNQVLVHQNCTNPLSTSMLSRELAHPLMSTPSLFTVIAAPIVLVLVAYQIVQRHRRTRTASDDAMIGAPRSGDLDGDGDAADSIWSWSTSTTAQDVPPPDRGIPTGRLDLTGWQAQRQEMIAKEQLLLAGLENASPNAGWMDFDDVEERTDEVVATRRSSVPPVEVSTETTGTPEPSALRAEGDLVDWTESDLAML